MGSGINISALINLSASTSAPTVISGGTSQGGVTAPSNGPWTPPQWGQPALTILTVPASSVQTAAPISGTNGSSAAVYQGTPATNYVFDAILRGIHNRRLKKTQHPVLTGANMADHAYIEPARVTLEIGMSDAMASYQASMWVGSSTKSISAWQFIKSLQVGITLVTLTTRLDTYYNMLVVDATAPDDYKTLHGLRGTIVLEETIAGLVASQATSSARPQATGSTASGSVQGTAPNAAQVAQNVIPSASYPDAATYPTVPGAGNVSSNSLGMLSTQ